MLIRTQRSPQPLAEDPYANVVRVHATPCYDLLVSLRALFNPRTYEATRAWSVTAKRQLSEPARARGRFFFVGQETSLGYGVLPLVATLPAGASPEALITAVRGAEPATLAMLMLDTGELSDEVRTTFYEALRRRVSDRALTEAFQGSSASWSKVCRRVIGDPEWARSELVALLEEHLEVVFATELEHVAAAIASGARRAEDLLSVLPTIVAIEQLTGGYTVNADLPLSQVVLAPSAFIHPFVASRLDVRTRSALVVFGVRTDSFDRFDAAPVDPAVLKAVKALGDPGRLRLLRLLARESLTSAELQSEIGLSPATVHHHLHQLRAAGFVRQERTKEGMRYTIRSDSAADLLDRLRHLVLGSE